MNKCIMCHNTEAERYFLHKGEIFCDICINIICTCDGSINGKKIIKELREIKQSPVFEKPFGRWELMTLDCPFWCRNHQDPDSTYGALSLEDTGSGEGESFRKSYQCDTCGIIVEWYPLRENPDWRVYYEKI